MSTNKRPKVAQKKARRIADFIQQMKTIILNVVNSPGYFSTITPAPAAFTTDVTDLETAETLAKTRVAGSVGARNIKLDVVKQDFNLWASQVQSFADVAGATDDAIAIINASGMGLKQNGVRVKAPIAVKAGVVSGTAVLTVKAAGRGVAYEWAMSNDGIAWTALPTTLQAKTSVTGLTPGATVHFRSRSVERLIGPGTWSQIVTLIIT